MLDFFRKHNRHILAILTALILVSWLVGAPLQQYLKYDPSKQEIGFVAGEAIRSRDLGSVQATTNILEALQIDWRHLGQSYNADAEPLNLEHWLLLNREAAKNGPVVTDRDVDDWFETQRVTPPVIDAIRNRNQVSLDNIRSAVAEYQRVARYASMASGVFTPSEREIRHRVRDLRDKIRVELVGFRADSFKKKDEKIAPAEAAAQFEQYKNNLSTENDLGYGYKWPRRVRVEYLAAMVTDLLPKIEVTEDEMRRYYRKNRDAAEFKVAVTQPANKTTTATASAPTQRTMSFTEARQQIERNLKRKAAIARIRDAMERIASDMARPWVDQPLGADGYKKLPDEVRQPSFFLGAKERLEKQYGIVLRARHTELLTERGALNDKEIGAAGTAGEGKDRLNFPQFAFRVPGFFEPGKGETSLHLSLFQTPDAPIYDTVNGEPYDRFIFRVIEARQPEVPASIEEVRARVEEDVREKHGYALADQRAREFFASARAVGIDAAFKAAPDLKDGKVPGVAPIPSQQFARKEWLLTVEPDAFFKAMNSGAGTLRPTYITAIGASSKEFVDACFDMASPLWTPPRVDIPKTSRPIAAAKPGSPGIPANYIPLPKLKMCIVTELKETEPVRQDVYVASAFLDAERTLIEERRTYLRSRWFLPSIIEQRCGFTRAKGESGRAVPAHPISPSPQNPGGYF